MSLSNKEFSEYAKSLGRGARKRVLNLAKEVGGAKLVKKVKANLANLRIRTM